MKNNSNLFYKAVQSISEEGLSGCASRTKRFMKKQIKRHKTVGSVYKDVLFISGCREDLPHPWRYRVVHQREQMEACHLSTDEVYYQALSMDQLRFYRVFIFFRCPYTDLLGNFAAMAKKLNKKVIYDIDDLVIDTEYTDQISYVQQMKKEDRQAYDANVKNMGKLLRMCHMAVTTTSCLAEELQKYVPTVIVNRNTASEEMVCLSRKALRDKQDGSSSKVRIGYFSGSITHNADIQMILPVLVQIMEKYEQVELCFVGDLDLPDELKKFDKRINTIPFSDWRKLPEMIAGIDINIAPLEDTIFNRAKSENKWMEAALVKVATIASDVGAFHDSIKDGVTGILCGNCEEWRASLERLIEDEAYRKSLGEEAYQYCCEHCTTVKTAASFVCKLKEEIQDNYGFVLPGLEISGGMKVALKHASILRKNGKDVVLFTLDNQTKWQEFEGQKYPVLSLKHTEIVGNIGCAIATMWTTVPFVEQYSNIDKRCYLVQNYETDFYEEGDPLRVQANRTYMPFNHVRFLTISQWCQKWLKDIYGQEALYAPNGLETEKFSARKRNFQGKIRILIEGDCAVSYKNVDEAFQITNTLDHNKFEVWYMSYNAQPKEWYQINKFLHKVSYDKVAEVYEACDILLKTSLLESFSYPPLEMMATGGYVLAVPNGGNAEYLKDEYNCLLYSAGDIERAKMQLIRICDDRTLQDRLYQNGLRTAKERNWSAVERDIMKLYIPESKDKMEVI